MHLHFTQSLEPLQGAGLGRSALGLHQGLLQIGVDSSLFTTRSNTFSNQWDEVRQFVRRGPSKTFFAPRMGTEARKAIRDARCLHGHGFYVYPNFLFGHHGRKLSKPLVYHIQGFFDPWILARSRLKKRIVHALFEKANFRYVSWWRAVSPKERQQARAYGIATPIEVLPNGVHLPPTRTVEEMKSLFKCFPKVREKRLIFLSRIHPKKGLDLLLKVWSDLDQALVRNWEIAVFGPDERGYLAEIKALARQLNIEDSVSFFGSVSGIDKEAAFRSGNLFVLPSRSEGFPLAVLEAASYALPVIQTTECNFPELTEAGGAWEGEPEIDSIKQVLESALRADDKERQQRGEAGKALVSRNYQWSAIAVQVEAACKKYC